MRLIRTLALAFATLAATGLPAAAEKLSLNQISNHLNTLQSVQGPFTQINADGTISTGTIYIKRPGKVRFEYNPPEKALVLASAGSVVVFDRKLGGVPEAYPLNRTPLSIILAREVNLAKAGMVRAHGYDGTATTVTAQDPARPEMGSIQLKFTDDPVELRQWVITDADGTRTTVVLGGLQRVTLPNRLFSIDREMANQR